jgi:hypothetical protein
METKSLDVIRNKDSLDKLITENLISLNIILILHHLSCIPNLFKQDLTSLICLA